MHSCGGRLGPLAKCNAIVERVTHGQFRHSPFLLQEVGTVVAIFLVIQFPMQLSDTGHIDICDGAGRAIAVVLAEIDRQVVSLNLYEDRCSRFETMLPIDLEAQKIEVKFARLFQRKNPENWDGALELYRHCFPPPYRSDSEASTPTQAPRKRPRDGGLLRG